MLFRLFHPVLFITALAVDEQVGVRRANVTVDWEPWRLRGSSHADLALFGARGTLTQTDSRGATLLGLETEGLVIG